MNKIFVTEENYLLNYLYKKMEDKSKNNIKSLLTNGYIYVNDKNITKYDFKLKLGDVIDFKYNINGIMIIYEDKNIIVVEKPSGLLTVSNNKEREKTLYHLVSEYLKKFNKNNKIFIVHRLDRDTSGIVMFAKSIEVQEKLQKDWNKIVKKREYVAIVEGITKASGTVTSYLKESNTFVYSSTKKDGKLAITHYCKKHINDKFSLLNIEIETGRKNQIRVHMKDINHPIIGDKKYGSSTNPLKRMGLHHSVLQIYYPFENKTITFKSNMPKSFINFMKKG